MSAVAPTTKLDWGCRTTWRRSAYNTMWCLIGCATGDLGTIFAFQVYAPDTSVMLVMTLAIINGLAASILLETVLMSRQMPLGLAFRTALGMSLVSMIGMEVAMNLVDYFLVGAAAIRWWSLPPTLAAGFLAPWPYNYWRLKKFGKACH